MTTLSRAGNHLTYNLDEHVALIKQQVDRSMRDPETRQLAVQIVSEGSHQWRSHPRSGERYPVVTAWGREFKAPPGNACAPRDEQCEIEKVWDFLVLNCRYVYDNRTIDQFATLQRSLEAGGGDCDDATIAFASLLGQLGFQVVARVITTKNAPNEWVHVYPMVGCSKDELRAWLPLDITVKGATPGWEYPDRAKVKDYRLV